MGTQLRLLVLFKDVEFGIVSQHEYKPDKAQFCRRLTRPEIHRPASRRPSPTSTPPERTRSSPALLTSAGTSPGRGFCAPRTQHLSLVRAQKLPPGDTRPRVLISQTTLAPDSITSPKTAPPVSRSSSIPGAVSKSQQQPRATIGDEHANPDPKGTGASSGSPEGKTTA